MPKLLALLCLVVALPACDKAKEKDQEAERPRPQVAAGDLGKRADPSADPTASWTEHVGDGFVVLGARAPTEEHQTGQTPDGPQDVAFRVGYEPAGFKGSFQTAVTVAGETAVKAGPAALIDNGVQGLLANLPGATIEKDEALPDHHGRRIIASGSHPQGGPFRVVVSMFFRDGKLYMVQALHADPKDAALAEKFVGSFEFVD